MAYKRGSGTVNVELARLQSWVEQADPDLYGEPGKKGIIEEHQERMMREANEVELSNKAAAKQTRIITIICAIPALFSVINFFSAHPISTWFK